MPAAAGELHLGRLRKIRTGIDHRHCRDGTPAGEFHVTLRGQDIRRRIGNGHDSRRGRCGRRRSCGGISHLVVERGGVSIVIAVERALRFLLGVIVHLLDRDPASLSGRQFSILWNDFRIQDGPLRHANLLVRACAGDDFLHLVERDGKATAIGRDLARVGWRATRDELGVHDHGLNGRDRPGPLAFLEKPLFRLCLGDLAAEDVGVLELPRPIVTALRRVAENQRLRGPVG